jgi:membrane-associated protein
VTALLASGWVFVVLFAFALLDGFFPPVPSETAVIALATAWVAGQGPHILLVVLVAAAGAFSGDQLAYTLGRTFSGRLAARQEAGLRGSGAVARVQGLIVSRGGPALLAARFVPGGRVAVTLAAGALRFPRRRFVAWTAGGTLLWASYYAAIGSVAGVWLRGNAPAAIVVGVAGGTAIGWLVDQVLRRRGLAVSAVADPVEEDVEGSGVPEGGETVVRGQGAADAGQHEDHVRAGHLGPDGPGDARLDQHLLDEQEERLAQLADLLPGEDGVEVGRAGAGQVEDDAQPGGPGEGVGDRGPGVRGSRDDVADPGVDRLERVAGDG